MPNVSDTDARWSGLYDSGRDFTLISSGSLTKLLSFTDDTLPKTCLDVGCGTGQLTRELYHRGYRCVGVDVSASAVHIASKLTVVPRDQLHYIQFDIEHDDITKLCRESYSLIICKLVYAFIKDKPAFLEKMTHMLMLGGVCIVITPHVDDMPVQRHGIAVDDEDILLLSGTFNQLTLYKGDELGGPLTYFVGKVN